MSPHLHIQSQGDSFRKLVLFFHMWSWESDSGHQAYSRCLCLLNYLASPNICVIFIYSVCVCVCFWYFMNTIFRELSAFYTLEFGTLAACTEWPSTEIHPVWMCMLA